MKVTITLTKQEAIDALLQFYKHTGATEIVISDDEQVKTDDGWISNVGRDDGWHPESLDGHSHHLAVKLRDGQVVGGIAYNWKSQWKETNGHPLDIVAYRVL